VAIITGSAQGLGKAFAQKLLQEGARVCLSDMNEETGMQTLSLFKLQFGQDRVHFVKCDVTNEEEFKALYDECEKYFEAPVSILANNAGVNTNFGWKKCMMVNIIGVMTGTELALERMSTANGGKGGLIVNTASLAGVTTDDPSMWWLDSKKASAAAIGGYPYVVSKHGVVALTRGLGQDPILSSHGVKVQCICPLWADTEIVSSITSFKQSDGDANLKLKGVVDKSIQVAGGLMTPEYVAENFYRVITTCGNGAVLAIVKNGPFLIPDTSTTYVIAMGLLTKLTKKMLGGQVLQIWHQMVFIAIIFLILHLLFGWLFV